MRMEPDQRIDVILAACLNDVIVQVWACIVLLLTLDLDGGSPRLTGLSSYGKTNTWVESMLEVMARLKT